MLDKRRGSTFILVSKYTAAATLAVGVVVILGWLVQSPAMMSLLPGKAPMKPNAALCFSFLGAGLLLAHTKKGRHVSQLMAVAVVLIGSLTLLEYISGWNLLIDNLLFHRAIANDPSTYPGRMNPNTCLGMALIGLALLLLGVRTRTGVDVSRILTAPVLLLGLLTTVGHAYGVTIFGGFTNSAAMSLYTGIVFIFFGIGLLCAKPEQGLISILTTDSPGSVILRTILPISLLVAFVMGWFISWTERHHILSGAEGTAVFSVSLMIVLLARSLSMANLMHTIDSERSLAEAKAKKLASFPEEDMSPVLRIGPSGEVMYANGPALYLMRAIGWTAGEPAPEILASSAEESGSSGKSRQVEVMVPSGKTYCIQIVPIASEGYVNLYGLDITAHKLAEQALHDSEERTRQILDSITDSFYSLDQDWRFVYINNKAASLWGKTQEELLGKQIWEAFPSVRETEMWPRMVEAVEEQRHIHVDASFSKFLNKWVEVDLYPTEQGLSVYFHDTTERRLAAEALRRSQEDLNRAQAVAHVGSWRMDVQRNVLEWSEENHRMFGIPEGMLMTYETFLSSVHPDDRERVDHEWKLALEGNPYDIEHRIIVNDSIKWVRERAELEFDDVGALIGGFGTTEDITERKHAEEALRDLAERLSMHMENSPLAVIEWNSEYRVIRWSEEAERVFGWSADEVLGKRIDEMKWVYEEDWPIVNRLMDDMNAGIRRRNVHPNRNYCKDGSVIHCEWYNSVLRDPSGEVASVLSLVLDVTARLEAQQTLQRHVSLLQRALAPSRPSDVPGYSAAFAYIPAFEGQEIGGDFYDIFRTEEGRIGILIGDVSGKGIEAAALASEARNAIRAFAYESSSPSMALGHANSLLTRHGRTRFATVFLVVLDPETGEFTYSGAGHPPALICRDEYIEELISRGIPIGLFDDAEYTEASSCLTPKDKIVLYTDGISEARYGMDFFGDEAIMQVLTGHSNEAPDELVNRLVNTAREWAHGSLVDDTAIVLVARD